MSQNHQKEWPISLTNITLGGIRFSDSSSCPQPWLVAISVRLVFELVDVDYIRKVVKEARMNSNVL